MTAPTKASLQRELRAMTRECDDLVLALATASARANKSDQVMVTVKTALRPVLAYFGEQWIGDRVRKEYQELVEFAKGSGDE